MPRTAYRKAATVDTVYTLIRVVQGNAVTCGQFSSRDNAMTAAEALIKQVCGLPAKATSAKLRLQWDGDRLVYGRDQHDFRFRIEAWPVDAEA